MLAPEQLMKLKDEFSSRDTRLADIFDALGDPTRFHIFQLLMEHRDICVTEIAAIFGISVPAASQQLKILKLTGLVEKERMGLLICYRLRIEDPLVISIVAFFNLVEDGSQ